METIRSFIAIELPEQIRTDLSLIEERLREGSFPSVKWVAPESIHLTLKFLGNVSQRALSAIVQVMAEVALGFPSFSLGLGEPGAFPQGRNPRVVWVGLQGETGKLVQLQRRIDTALHPLGFSPEARPFTPHLTLARVREGTPPRERQSLGDLIAASHFEPGLVFVVDSLSLMKSQLTSAGALYSRLALAKLKKD